MNKIESRGIISETHLPNDWQITTLGDVCDFLDSRRVPVNNAERERRIAGKPKGDLYPYYGANGQVGWIDDFIFDEALILLAEDGGAFGSTDKAVAYPVNGKCWVNNHAHVLRPREMVDFDFCTLALGIRPDIGELVTGSTRPKLNQETAAKILIPLPPLPTQRRIAAQLKAQLAEVDCARAALQAQLNTTDALVTATLRDSLSQGATAKVCIADCLKEVTQGIGPKWNEYPVLGATRAGLAPAKEGVGKAPERYKPVRVGTVFYNPMRILLGSIAMVDEGDAPGITSPDYVVMTAMDGVLHPRWFYQWFRSADGAAFVCSLTRGAVRERLLFKRLAPAEIHLPPWPAQTRAAEIFRAVAVIRKQALARLATLDRLPAALLRQVFGEASVVGSST